MLTKEQNDLLTQTGPGTAGGDLLRRYWQPVGLSEELPARGAPIPVRILGEDLVLFRDEQERLGLIGLHCSHRGADLSYGRLEDGGLRCIYHGWLYDINGRCLEQPGEPAGRWTSNSWTYSGGRDLADSAGVEAQAEGATAHRQAPGRSFHERIRHPAYACHEVGGVIFTYMGSGEPPLFPNYEFLHAPDTHTFSTKYWHDCNYLQGNEGNIDPTHLSFLHRFLREDMAAERERQARTPGARGTTNSYYGRDLSPHLQVEETDFGIRIFSVRNAGDGQTYLRVSNFIYPNLSAFPGGTGADGYSVNWHVPADDTHHWKFSITFRRASALNREWTRGQHNAEVGPDYRMRRNKENRYLQDREEMNSRSFIGLGVFFPAHDKLAVEGPGPIQDRTQEHTSHTDKAIVMQRLLLLKAIHQIQEGKDAPHVIRDPAANDLGHLGGTDMVIDSSEDWRTAWKRGFPALREPAQV